MPQYEWPHPRRLLDRILRQHPKAIVFDPGSQVVAVERRVSVVDAIATAQREHRLLHDRDVTNGDSRFLGHLASKLI
jgi:hypothetical protein